MFIAYSNVTWIGQGGRTSLDQSPIKRILTKGGKDHYTKNCLQFNKIFLKMFYFHFRDFQHTFINNTNLQIINK